MELDLLSTDQPERVSVPLLSVPVVNTGPLSCDTEFLTALAGLWECRSIGWLSYRRPSLPRVRQASMHRLRAERVHRWLDGEVQWELFNDLRQDEGSWLLPWMAVPRELEHHHSSLRASMEIADRLSSSGHRVAAANARSVVSNFLLAGWLRAQATYDDTALSESHGVAARVQGMAEWGLLYMTAFEACRERDSRRLDALWLLNLLYPDLLDAGAAWLMVRRVARELNTADIPDAPHRALPRETRAGPDNYELEK